MITVPTVRLSTPSSHSDLSPWHYPSLPAEPAVALAQADVWCCILRPLFSFVSRSILRALFHLECVNTAAIPRHGPFVIAANHTSHADCAALVAAVPVSRTNNVHPLAARDYFFQSRALGLLVHVLFNALPFDRTTRVMSSLRDARLLLSLGHGLILFPEGTRSANGRMQSFRGGVGLLLAGTGIPAIPAYVHGGMAVLPRGAQWPRRGRLRVVFGAPAVYSDYVDTASGWLAVASDLERRVRALASSESSGSLDRKDDISRGGVGP